MQLTCRFYKNQFPDTDEPVMVNVTEVEEIGVYVNLLEYNNRQGMILLNELTRRRIRSINKLIRVGRNEVVVVVRVDRGYIDLSKRRVSPDDASKCEEKFARGKTVNSILRHTAELLQIDNNEQFEELYENTAWFLDEKYRRPGAAYDIFVRAVSDEHVLDDCPVDENTKQILLTNIRRHLTPQAVKCRADVEVACYGYEGVDAVKAALKAGLMVVTEDMPVKINLIAPPLYVITATCLDRAQGLGALKVVLEQIKQEIERYRGIFKIKMEPKVVTDADTDALRKRMIDIEYENQERPGDDDYDSDQNEDGGISGKLPGEDDDELVRSNATVKESRTTFQRNPSNANNDNKENEDDDDED